MIFCSNGCCSHRKKGANAPPVAPTAAGDTPAYPPSVACIAPPGFKLLMINKLNKLSLIAMKDLL